MVFLDPSPSLPSCSSFSAPSSGALWGTSLAFTHGLCSPSVPAARPSSPWHGGARAQTAWGNERRAGAPPPFSQEPFHFPSLSAWLCFKPRVSAPELTLKNTAALCSEGSDGRAAQSPSSRAGTREAGEAAKNSNEETRGLTTTPNSQVRAALPVHSRASPVACGRCYA